MLTGNNPVAFRLPSDFVADDGVIGESLITSDRSRQAVGTTQPNPVAPVVVGARFSAEGRNLIARIRTGPNSHSRMTFLHSRVGFRLFMPDSQRAVKRSLRAVSIVPSGLNLSEVDLCAKVFGARKRRPTLLLSSRKDDLDFVSCFTL